MPSNLCVPFERGLFIGVSTILFALACGATPPAGKQCQATSSTSENGSQMVEPGPRWQLQCDIPSHSGLWRKAPASEGPR